MDRAAPCCPFASELMKGLRRTGESMLGCAATALSRGEMRGGGRVATCELSRRILTWGLSSRRARTHCGVAGAFSAGRSALCRHPPREAVVARRVLRVD